ncbi:pentapeptide repeat-containing protein [Nocardia rhamnosiphila]
MVLAIAGGGGAAVAAYGVLRWITPTSDAEAAPIDVTRVSLTIVAGVGGVVALVIAYRRQRDVEQSRFVEQFGAAAAQLGSDDVAVRIAGVYAMAGTADESDGVRRQQCIDVLCGYLRLPYLPERGANHQIGLTLTHHRTSGDGTATDDEERRFDYRQNDREVRKTIVRVIAERLRPHSERSWSAYDFDFRGAHLEEVDLSRAVFAGEARFDAVTFAGDAWFDAVTFVQEAWFDKAIFAATPGSAQRPSPVRRGSTR